jgi:hypothetical protein
MSALELVELVKRVSSGDGLRFATFGQLFQGVSASSVG